jgi:single-stranded-DNA-specific exonuclease
MIKNWSLPKPLKNLPQWALSLSDDNPIIAQMMLQRGIETAQQAEQFLNPEAYTPASPYDLPDMDLAVQRVQQAIQLGENILIWGDFDVDGQTSTSLLASALKGLGANVSYYIPQRGTEGHGITISRLQTLIDERDVQLIVTCDTGIAEHEAIIYATTRGVDTVVTDHHQLTPTLPPAVAVVNPQRLAGGHPLRTLPGVGAAYKLMEALYTEAGRADELTQFLDLVALGIVADVVVVVDDARYLLQRGLEVLRQTERAGLQALYELAKVNPAKVDEETIGFTIAPRLNAVGRMGDANMSVEFLTTSDTERAIILANELEGMNNRRKFDTERITSAAVAMVEDNPQLLKSSALVLSKEGWGSGIIGIVANRLVEQFNRPVVLFSENDGFAHGSARSVAGCNITQAIQQVADQNPDMILGFGGHMMAAGLQLEAVRVSDFRRALSRAVADQLGTGDDVEEPTLTIDALLGFDDVTLSLAHDLRKIAPFGPGNPAPLFATERVKLRNQRQLGKTGDHLRLTVEDQAGHIQEVVWWRADLEQLPKGRFDIAYRVGINEYQGQSTPQAVLEAVRPVDEEPETFDAREQISVIDYRKLSTAQQLEQLALLEDDVLIWNEGEAIPNRESVRRDGLQPAQRLAIWTAPPSAPILKQALERTNPAEVILFNQPTGTDDTGKFLSKLIGLTSYLIKAYDGKTELEKLAGATGQRIETVKSGLRCLHARRYITIMALDDTHVQIERDGVGDWDVEQTTQLTQEITRWIYETQAYRRYYQQTASALLLGMDVINP